MIFIAFCDVLVIYLLTNNLCGLKTTIAFRKIKIIPAIGLIIAFFIFYALGQTFLPRLVYISLSALSLPLLIWLSIDKKKIILSLAEVVLIWFLIYVMLNIMALPFMAIATVLATTETGIIFITYFVTTIIIVILCQKLDFNRFLVFILRRTIFKVLIFFVALLLFITAATIDYLGEIFEHGFISLPLLILALTGLIHTIKLVHQNTTIIPEAYHDAKKLLMLLDIKAKKTTDVSELKEMLAESIDLMNLQLPGTIPSVGHTEINNFETFIFRTIEAVKKDKKSNTKIISNIQFTDRYDDMNDIKFAYMVGLFLEHVLDKLTKRPIFINIISSKKNASIQISCEYKFENNLKHLENFFLNSHISHLKTKNNFNLLKLKSLLDIHDGKTVITREKNIQEGVDYLSVYFIFGKAGEAFG